MGLKSILKNVKDLWSLAKGLGVTGRMLFLPNVTVHYPRKEVRNLAGFRGPIALVPRPEDSGKPKCIACLMCMNTCPSHCITVVKMKPPKPAGEAAQGEDEKGRKPAVPKEPETFSYNYSLCSLCGMCADVCPVDSIRFSTDAYRVTRDRQTLEMNLLANLKTGGRTAVEEKEA
jgi:NADH-quinone oxidoreductase subunit I